MLKIYVARHGQNEDNANGILNGHRDHPLTEVGIQQAMELMGGIKKAGITFDKIYSSPLRRAYTTATIVAQGLNLPDPDVLHGLIERDFGVMTGRPVADIERLYGSSELLFTDTITYFLTAKGAEEYPIVFDRAGRMLEYVRALHEDGSILLVCHSDIGKMLYASSYGLSWRETLELFHFGNSELLLLADGTALEDRHVIKLEQFNH